MQRPDEFANDEFLTEAQAAEYEKTALERLLEAIPETDRTTAADLNDMYLDTLTLKLVDGVLVANASTHGLRPQADVRNLTDWLTSSTSLDCSPEPRLQPPRDVGIRLRADF